MQNFGNLSKWRDANFRNHFLPIFLKSCRSSIIDLEENLFLENWDHSRHLIHKLVGTLSAVGDEELVQILIEVKEKIKKQDYSLAVKINEFYEKYMNAERLLKSNYPNKFS